jgi:hypothetical protein
MNHKTEGRVLRNRIDRRLQRIRSIHPKLTDLGRIQDVEDETSAMALEIGELLAASELSRGPAEWRAWIRRFLPIGHKTAENYVRVWLIRDRVRVDRSHDTSSEAECVPDTSNPIAWLNQLADLYSDIDGIYRGLLRYTTKRRTRRQMVDFTLQRLLDLDQYWHPGDIGEPSNQESRGVDDPSVLQLAADDGALARKVIPLIERHMLMAMDLCTSVRRLCRYAKRLWYLAEEALVDASRFEEITEVTS